MDPISTNQNLFRRGARIGGGGFADVFECMTKDGSKYAQKVLNKTDPASIARFTREVRILHTLNHPNIVRVVAKRLNAPPYFFVMPIYKWNLKNHFPAIVGRRERIIPIFSAILEAMDYAHEQNVVHRDLKPSNFLLNADNDLVIADFGYGKRLNSNSEELTKSGTGFGTEGYACPEQWDEDNAKSAGKRCDIYTLGIILYELFAGLLNGAHPQLEKLTPDIRFLVDRCIQTDPERRFQSIAELKRSLVAIMGNPEDPTDLLQIKKMAAQLNSDRQPSQTLLDSFAELLSKLHDDQDVVNEALLLAGPGTMALLLNRSRSVATGFIRNFCAFANSQIWPFDHARTIAKYCDELSEQVEDLALYSELTVCLLHLARGGDHRVMTRYRRRLIAEADSARCHCLAERLIDIEREPARDGYLQVALVDKLSMEIRCAFEHAILNTSEKNRPSTESMWQKLKSHLASENTQIAQILGECVAEPIFFTRTIVLPLLNCPLERLDFHVPYLEDEFLKVNGFKIIVILKP